MTNKKGLIKIEFCEQDNVPKIDKRYKEHRIYVFGEGHSELIEAVKIGEQAFEAGLKTAMKLLSEF